MGEHDHSCRGAVGAWPEILQRGGEGECRPQQWPPRSSASFAFVLKIDGLGEARRPLFSGKDVRLRKHVLCPGVVVEVAAATVQPLHPLQDLGISSSKKSESGEMAMDAGGADD